MSEVVPKWAQPFAGEKVCSICKSKDVYFQMIDAVEEAVEVDEETDSICLTFFLKVWCKECFDEYGGNV